MLAPNSSNLQPWEFFVIRTPDLKTRLAEACLGQNAARTAPIHYNQGPFGLFGATNPTALAAENLILALRAHSYDSCPMEGFNERRVTLPG